MSTVEIKITGATPLEALTSLAAFGLRCLHDPEVTTAANRVLEAELAREATGAAQPPKQPSAPVAPAAPVPAPTPVPVAVPTPAPVAVSTPPAAPVATPAPVPVSPMPTPITPAPSPVPLAPAPSFDVERIGRAGAALIDANPAARGQLYALLDQYGVPAISELKPEQMGAFATALRGLGAKI